MDAMQYNSEALDAIWGQIGGYGFTDSRRNQLVSAYVSIVLEHQSAIRLLLDNGIAGSAGTLLRSQIEASFRGLWVALIGTDAQLEQIINKDREPFPRFRTLARLLDRSYKTYGVFAHIAQHWKTFNSMTHSGMAQIARRFDRDGMVRATYSLEEVDELLRFSATVSLLCVNVLFRLAQAVPQAEALEAWIEEHGERKDAGV
jgi:hypothetical protein